MSIKNPRHHLLLAALLAMGVTVGVAACGGSSKSSSTTAAASAGAVPSGTSGASGPSGPGGPGGRARFAAVRECLEKNGVTLPKRTPGQAPRGGFLGGGGGFAGGQQLPNGVSREKFEAAMKKCGVPQGRFGATGRFNSARRTASLTKFASCMREHGINLPAPNTSGSGPVFNTKGLDTTTPQFKAALSTCRSELTTLFRPGGSTGSTGEVKTD